MKKERSITDVTIELQRERAGNMKTSERIFLQNKSMDEPGKKSILAYYFDAIGEILTKDFEATPKPLC